MSTKSRQSLYGIDIQMSAERAKEARKVADRLAVKVWNDRMLGYQGPAQPSPTIGDALNAGYGYLEVRCLGCDTHQTVALDIVRRPKPTSRNTTGILANGAALTLKRDLRSRSAVISASGATRPGYRSIARCTGSARAVCASLRKPDATSSNCSRAAVISR